MSDAEAARLKTALNSFVLSALQQQSAACSAAGAGRPAAPPKNYHVLLQQLQAAHEDPLALSRWYAALSKSVASMHANHHSDLLQFLYMFDFASAASVRNVEQLVQLLVAMCVGGQHIQAIGPVLKTLVSSFIATNGKTLCHLPSSL
jgi:hypothetical protein